MSTLMGGGYRVIASTLYFGNAFYGIVYEILPLHYTFKSKTFMKKNFCKLTQLNTHFGLMFKMEKLPYLFAGIFTKH